MLLVPQVLFTLGFAWFLAALGVYLRDLGQMIGFLLTLWFFLTPICYPEASLPPEAAGILTKNPDVRARARLPRHLPRRHGCRHGTRCGSFGALAIVVFCLGTRGFTSCARASRT